MTCWHFYSVFCSNYLKQPKLQKIRLIRIIDTIIANKKKSLIIIINDIIANKNNPKINCYFQNIKDQNGQFLKITALWLKLDFGKFVADNLWINIKLYLLLQKSIPPPLNFLQKNLHQWKPARWKTNSYLWLVFRISISGFYLGPYFTERGLKIVKIWCTAKKIKLILLQFYYS